ncbi:MAG TPA: nucleoside 2-deoxyribosyltransferase [Pseudogracilibacillus sp.]|nr:nucleoside 2-deoxyribosyltransferase [Pseudogracilibacillus sp.]
MEKKIYLAGGMMSKGEQMQRAAEAADVRALGYEIYNPMENKDINDKKNAKQEGLAERIVKQDSEAIYESDILVIEPQSFALGTITELGQVKGRKDLAKEILEISKDASKSNEDVLFEVLELAGKIVEQQVYPHYQDIRRFEGVTESEDRRSLGINQYVYGVCLDLTDGKGFYEWDEILEELEKVRDSE